MAIDHSTIIEGFVIDPGFVDRSKAINGILLDETGSVATLTPKALSYFSQPSLFTDKRTPADRNVAWTAETNSSVVLDEDVFSSFTATINSLNASQIAGFFKLIDKLVFDYNYSLTHSDLESFLVSEGDISSIYVPGSFSLSSTIVEDNVYYGASQHASIAVPTFIKFSLNLPTGASSTTYVVTLYAQTDAWLTGYNVSNIVKVVPPLAYAKLYSSSLLASTDNIFTTASLTATLAYNTTQAVLGTVSVSGITEYNAVLTDDANNTASVPFNIIFKGRQPTLSEVREAIKTELLNSDVGNEAGWQARIPGVFVAGRFYIVPYWDVTYSKPDQVVFPSVIPYSDLGSKVNTILESLSFGDVTSYTDIMATYYNRMTVGAVPDLSGSLDVNHISTVMPDYQSFSPDEDNFGYMGDVAKEFSQKLNQILAIDSGASSGGVYTPITENLISFYSFTVATYEICVITKLCYTTIMGSTQ